MKSNALAGLSKLYRPAGSLRLRLAGERTTALSNLRFYSRWIRIRLHHAIAPRDWSDADPHKILRVSTNSIEHCSWDTRLDEGGRPRFRRHFSKEDMGRVVDGDWDMRSEPFEESLVYRLIWERYVRDVPWEATEVFRFFRRRIEAGEAIWHDCASMADLRARTERVDRLFHSMQRHGYCRQQQVQSNSRRKQAWLDEIAVNVDRRGKLLHNQSGAHRLAIAKVLNFNHIFVRILVRHRQWQDLRDEIRASRSPEKISEKARELMTHPDLQDIAPACAIVNTPNSARKLWKAIVRKRREP